ncbi:MAG TPA: TRAP transporter small permease [Dehalococcoidales bacterium]|nr:TRAP transporter small permease [Dehalococcoidales bacterium]
MASFERIVQLISRYADWIARAGVVAMMLLAAGNILLRIFGHPIAGTFDYISFMGATLVAFALAYCAVNRGHIQVELLMDRLPGRVQGIIGILTGILGAGIFILVTWRSMVYANNMRVAGETTMTALLPYYPYIYAIAFGSALLCLVVIVDLMKSVARAVKG